VADKKELFVDSCVLLDIITDDKNWADWSHETLNQMSLDYQLVINIIVFSEISLKFNSADEVIKILELMKIKMLELPIEVGFNVSRVFKQYRSNKGTLKSAMPDFYIGEHAKYLNVPLVTRDLARFKTYQPELKLISPKTN
jgi:predicted nucleic acid-binding protein